MKTKVFLLLITAGLVISCNQRSGIDYLSETQEQKDQRMEWFRDARFGMFIHWGLYSIPAGEWNGETNYGEWIRESAHIPLEQYNTFVDQFNPVRFNADEWVKMAKDAGMKYIVITSKHHDGFGLFNSRHTSFDVMSTPFKRDILKELSVACEKEGMTFCFYHSIMDWHHPDYLPRRTWETDRSSEGADFEHYVTYMKKQLKELLTHYGKLGILWFDGEWESTWTEERGKDLYQFVRSYQPDIIVNNRVTTGRSGMEGLTEAGAFAGDYGTPEQEIPATGIPGVDWESCMTMNDHWGYNKNDKNFKSTREILRMLADIASKGGNYLLNVGPTAEGVFPHESIDRLKEIGTWMKTNGESIYGTQASPFKHLPWGRCTQKKMTESSRLYLHVFDWPVDQKLVIPGLGSKTIRAFLLADPNQEELVVTKDQADVIITLPVQAPDQNISVVVLDIEKNPIIFDSPAFAVSDEIFIGQLSVSLSKGEQLSEIFYTTDASLPTSSSMKYTGPFSVMETTTITAACFMNGERVSEPSVKTLVKVVPLVGRTLPQSKPGLLFNLYSGEWDSMPDFNGIAPKLTGVAIDFSLANKSSEENFAIDYQGFINIEKEGVYTFYLSSDDGSKMYLGDDLAIDHDGLHGSTVKNASFALSPGLHSFRICFFEKTGGNALELKWKTGNSTPVAVPKDAFFHYK